MLIVIGGILLTTIHVKKLDEATFEVKVENGIPTTHVVNVTKDYVAKLTGGRFPEETLIKHSFEFLLEREPNTSILRRFDLPTIARYFPEYERIIGGMLK
jgi:hypothetical protein